MSDTLSLLILALALIGAGLSAGLIAGLLGVGGGIVIVPVLFQLFTQLDYGPAITMHLAVGTSLASIVPTSLSAVLSHLRRDSVDVDLVRRWSPGVVVGVLIGTALAGMVHGVVLSGLFATVAFLVACYMTLVPEGTRLRESLPRLTIQRSIAGGIGMFSAMMGIGGGTLTVPTLVLCGTPIRNAVATSSAIGMIIAIPGALGFMIAGYGVPDRPPLSIGYVSLLGLVLTAPTAMMTAPVGARLVHFIPSSWLRRLFAIFLLMVSVRMAWSVVGG